MYLCGSGTGWGDFYGREGKQEYGDEPEYKYNNVVDVSYGDEVYFRIHFDVKSANYVRADAIYDYYPNGVKIKLNGYWNSFVGDEYCDPLNFDKDWNTNNKIKLENYLDFGDGFWTSTFMYVIEPNISVHTLKNVIEIGEILYNKNGVKVKDSTPNDNRDADYIKLNHPTEKEETVDYTVEKRWENNNNYSQPAQVKVKLIKIKGAREIDLGMESVTLCEGAWTYTWKELPKLEDGWYYAVRELNDEGTDLLPGNGQYYNGSESIKVSYTDEESITTIINTIKYEPPEDPPEDPPDPKNEKTSLTVEKVWQNDKEDTRTDITVKLYRKENGNWVEVTKDASGKDISEITLSERNWTSTWNNLPKYWDDGETLIEYRAKEVTIGSGLFGIKHAKEVTEITATGGKYTVSYLYEADKTTVYNTFDPDEEEPEDDTLVISGVVWNDMALDKTSNDYNGQKDDEENYLSGIKVDLYRVGIDKIVASTETNEFGEYCFRDEDLNPTVITNAYERYIKGPKVSNYIDRWAGTFYKYYVIFTYDGVTYTSTDYETWETVAENNSNAKEDYGKISKTREDFNKQFETINGSGAGAEGVEDKDRKPIKYTKINEAGYIPQSNYVYDPTFMSIQSSTEEMNFSSYGTNVDSLEHLQGLLTHVNLGLKGRDIFDLEITSDVYSTKVTVNGVEGTYNYNDNKITVRRNDCNNYNYKENIANVHYEDNCYLGDYYTQKVRNTDIRIDEYEDSRITNWAETGLEIEVTYKITVKNTSSTTGYIKAITNYYDDCMEVSDVIVNGYSRGAMSSKSGAGYEGIRISLVGNEGKLKEGESIDVYVTYWLKDPVGLMKDLKNEEGIATYNMSEICEYGVDLTDPSSDKYTIGLIDKDSAPDSAESEKVNLAPDLIGTQSTVNYYFGENDLSKLKYEDDTYATPTLYFVKDESERVIEGTVFEDKTEVDPVTKVKTGNGVLDEGEVGVYGATVELIEQVGDGIIRYKAITNENGAFEFSGYLPGNYIIRYHYGDTEKTVIIDKNSKSYNGEDYQATNNGLNATVAIDPKLSNVLDYWYVYNEDEGISTGFDDVDRRIRVKKNVLAFTDAQMDILKDVRSGSIQKKKDEDGNDIKDAYGNVTYIYKDTNVVIEKQLIENLIEETNMFADTQKMLFTVEETFKLSDYETDELSKMKYNKINDYLGTWAIFPDEADYYKEYKIENMNFGIAEVPITTIDITKTLDSFTIKDSTGQNTIASFIKDKNSEGNDVIKGTVTRLTADRETNRYWAQIENEKLQGARLEITFNITVNINVEKNFDNSEPIENTIKEFVDFIDNNLSFNSSLGENKDYWEITTYQATKDGIKDKSYEIKADYSEELNVEEISNDGNSAIVRAEGTVIDEAGDKFATIVKAKGGNPILQLKDGSVTVPITLEKVLTSSSTLEEYITEIGYEYTNNVEIIQLNYTNTRSTGGKILYDENGNLIVTNDPEHDETDDYMNMEDRIRRSKEDEGHEEYVVLPGVGHDYETSDELIITPPTGESSISITYYIIAVISLAVMGIGVFGIKKFVINSKS